MPSTLEQAVEDAISSSSEIPSSRREWTVPSSSRPGTTYAVVRVQEGDNTLWSCGCPDWIFRRRAMGGICRHIRDIQSGGNTEAVAVNDAQHAPSRQSGRSAQSGTDKPPRQRKLWELIRSFMKNGDRRPLIERSLDILDRIKAKYPKKCRQEEWIFYGPDFLIDPRLDRIVSMPMSGETFQFHRIPEIRDEARRLARTLKGNLYGLGSVRFKTTDPSTHREAYFLQVSSRTYRIERSGRLVEVQIPLDNAGICPTCKKHHLTWGMEAEFDAPRLANLEAETIKVGSMPFQPIGRDGQGQGEVRSMPSDSFEESANSLVHFYNKALEIVAGAKEIGSLFKAFVRDHIAQNPYVSKDHIKASLTGLESDHKPNGIHIHGPSDPYIKELIKIVAVWWNQKDAESKLMIDRRLKNSYGKIDHNNDSRQSGVCGGNRFTEYRSLNSDTPEKIQRLLIPVLKKALESRPELPRCAKEYHNPTAFETAKMFCESLLQENPAAAMIRECQEIASRITPEEVKACADAAKKEVAHV